MGNTKIDELRNIIYLPMFKNYYQNNKFEEKVLEKNNNVLIGLKTEPSENCVMLTTISLLNRMCGEDKCFVRINTKKIYDDNEKKTTFNNLDYLKFERIGDKAILCTHFTYVNGLDGKPHFKTLPDSACFYADKNSASPLGIEFFNVNGYVFANKIDSFRFLDYQTNRNNDMHKDSFWENCEKKL